MNSSLWTIDPGDGPLVAAAIHHGHTLRPEIAALMALDDAARRREEDPFTGDWTGVAPTRIVVHRSRFEMDLNRPRDKAVYLSPLDAWGLEVWRTPPTGNVLARSLAQYDDFYRHVHGLFSRLAARYGHFVVLDLHSYNHRREGPAGPPADPALNPEVNLGTGSLDRFRWNGVVNQFMADLQNFDYQGRHLDVRENVKFFGGHFSRWTHQQFPDTACVLAVEFKKFFMDEWSGQPDPRQLDTIRQALAATVPGLRRTLHQL